MYYKTSVCELNCHCVISVHIACKGFKLPVHKYIAKNCYVSCVSRCDCLINYFLPFTRSSFCRKEKLYQDTNNLLQNNILYLQITMITYEQFARVVIVHRKYTRQGAA